MPLLLRIRRLIPFRNRRRNIREAKMDVTIDISRSNQVALEAYLVLNRRVDWDQAEETWYILTGLDFEEGDRLLLLHGRNNSCGDLATATRKLGSFGPSGAIHRWAITFTD